MYCYQEACNSVQSFGRKKVTGERDRSTGRYMVYNGMKILKGGAAAVKCVDDTIQWYHLLNQQRYKYVFLVCVAQESLQLYVQLFTILLFTFNCTSARIFEPAACTFSRKLSFHLRNTIGKQINVPGNHKHTRKPR